MKLQFRLGPLRHYCPGEALVLAEAHQMLSKLKGKIFLNQLSQIIHIIKRQWKVWKSGGLTKEVYILRHIIIQVKL